MDVFAAVLEGRIADASRAAAAARKAGRAADANAELARLADLLALAAQHDITVDVADSASQATSQR
ncbi:hypothetical protein [Amycolatopsis sp. cmx-11-51]|uniref:hypothetical protein n=1 Tax=unclassified Amycolatopsis TaxID=2618356 RepID=UPI0039E2BE5C